MLETLAICFMVSLLCFVVDQYKEAQERLKTLEEIEKTIDPDFENHKELWDYYNNNYIVLVRI